MAAAARREAMTLRLVQLWRRRSETALTAGLGQDKSADERANEVGDLIRERREALGLNLRELALQTRITTPVLEAMERGWRDRLPERTYLAAMVSRLEQALTVPAGTLEAVLPPPSTTPLHGRNRQGLRRFTPGSIDVVTTWQGSLLYGVVIGISLLAINRQQQVLIQQNSLNLEPVRAALAPPPTVQTPTVQTASEAPVLDALRPLAELGEQPPQRWLTALKQSSDRGPGILEIQLSRPSQLTITSGGGDRLALNGTKGTLTLSLLQPFTVSVDPIPAPQDRVLWNGTLLLPQAAGDGTYSMPSTAEAPARERPQTAPLSP
ncbi:MAG: helix-turn-helix domain-containing protein [Synechococcus sp.]